MDLRCSVSVCFFEGQGDPELAHHEGAEELGKSFPPFIDHVFQRVSCAYFLAPEPAASELAPAGSGTHNELHYLARLHYYATMHTVNVKPQEIFQALADPTRVRIIRLLAETGEEACLCELVDSLLEPQYKLSRHVKTLRQAGLLSAEKEGRWVYHRLVRGVPYLELAYDMLRALPDVDGLFAQDLRNFRERMCLREGGRCRVGIQTASLTAEGE